MVVMRRTVESSKAYNLEPAGRATQLDKIYIGFVKDTNDQQRMGRIKVWIPEVSGNSNDESQWLICSYASPFAGASSIYDSTNGPSWENTQRSYGFWFVPPDLENEVLVCFIGGDPGRGIWFGCLYQQNMNHMVPGIPADSSSNNLPVAEYNKLKTTTAVDTATAPVYTPLADQLKIQGLDVDEQRGQSTAGARRESPINSAYGILTPGGSQFVMDDSLLSKYIRLRTQQGTQILINDNEGFIYMITRDGNSWVELGQNGDINVYGSKDISVRSQGTMNLHADLDINIEAGRSIFMRARGEVSSILTNRPQSTTPTGEIIKAYTSSNAVVPAISVKNSMVTITAPTNTITGTFIPGMDITGIPWNNPTTSSAPAPTQPVDNTTSNTAGSGASVVVIGDYIAGGVAPLLAEAYQGTVTNINYSATIADVLATVKSTTDLYNAQYAVISVGGNDANNGENTAGEFTTNLQSIRTTLNAQNYIWILPNDPTIRNIVSGFATGGGDAVQDIATNDIGRPDYAVLSNNIKGNIGQTTAPMVTPTTDSSATTEPATPPKCTLSSVSLNEDGSQIILNVTFLPGSQSINSNASVIIGTLQNETEPTQPVATNNNTTTAGMIMINANRDLHVTSNNDMYIRSNGLMSRVAKKNMFDYAYGSYDMAAGGYLTMQSNGLFSIGTSNNIVMGAAKIDLNGPAPAAAKAGPDALEPIDSQQKDTAITAPGQLTFTLVNTIVSKLPAHEPWDGHAATAQGYSGYVETGSSIDPVTGHPLQPGQVICGQQVPLDIMCQPTPGSKPGSYKGTGYDSKGQPQYAYQGPVTDQLAPGSFRLSTAGAEFITVGESPEPLVYPDAGGLPTIGIGHKLLPDERAGNYVNINGVKRMLTSPLSSAEIIDLFKQDIAPREQIVRKAVTAKLTQTQFDMLVSFVYNIGNCNSIAAILNSGSYDVTQKWMSYVHVKGKVVQGLVNRRRSEVTNFLKGTPINNGGV